MHPQTFFVRAHLVKILPQCNNLACFILHMDKHAFVAAAIAIVTLPKPTKQNKTDHIGDPELC